MADHKVPRSGEFSDGKLWFNRRGTVLTVGLTNLAIDEMGSVERIEFSSQGDDCAKGDVLATVDGSRGKIEIVCPATGTVQEVNEALVEEPDTIVEDPLDEGWLVKIEIEDTSDLEEYAAHS